MKNIKEKMAALLCTVLCMVLCAAAFADSAAEPAVLELGALYTDEGFIYPGTFAFGDALDGVVKQLPSPETMSPGSDSFDERKYVESSENGYVSITPEIVYTLGGQNFTHILEFDAEHTLYGYWLTSDMCDAAAMTDEEKAAWIDFIVGTVKALDEKFDMVIQKGPETIDELSFDYFTENGKCILFFAAADGTYARISVGISPANGHYNCSIGIGLLEKWPGMSEFAANYQAAQ